MSIKSDKCYWDRSVRMVHRSSFWMRYFVGASQKAERENIENWAKLMKPGESINFPRILTLTWMKDNLNGEDERRCCQISSQHILKGLDYAKEFRFYFGSFHIGFIHGCLFTTKYTVTIMGHCMSYFATNKCLWQDKQIGVFRREATGSDMCFYLVRPEGKISAFSKQVGAALKQSWGQLGGDTLASSYSNSNKLNYWNANIVIPTPCISFLPFLFHSPSPPPWGDYLANR